MRRAVAALDRVVPCGPKVVVLVVIEVVFVGGLGRLVGVCRNWMGVFGGVKRVIWGFGSRLCDRFAQRRRLGGV